ncbi:potassium channel family protein [Roseofilum casamattae]|uniref:NAD-binding protein n=1 Tax=Roseofilum casamattae BLCC-M143 TaxID=3022442 RepID=A0ABT7BYU8_9CYAN|nr:NAD-binding protein [Roseofilum casamattae]MDJ1184368.1 NAD-binding protein [Roseofilum casamattae BLCC-M143]
MKPRIIVCGLGRTGYTIFSLLRQQGALVIGISTEPIPGEEERTIVGELRSASTLLKAGIIDADTLIIATHDDAENLAILVQARVLNPKIRVINRLFNTNLGDRLDRTLPQHTTMSVSSLAAPVFVFAAFGNQAIGQLQLYNQTWPIYEEYIDSHHPWQGKSLTELWENPNRMLIYYLPHHGKTDLISAVANQRTLQVGDRLILAAQPSPKRSRISAIAKLRKFITYLGQFQQHVRSSVLVTLLLLSTILIATFTYTWINWEISLVDALYFSVGMITGAGGKEEVAEQAPAAVKLFTAVMMLVGAGIVGIGYALLNDWVLGTRFRKLLETAPIPSKHHFIVCGLGGIGIQIARQLHDKGYDVVIIEPDTNCRFLNTAYSLKIPVILSDACLATTLETANINSAEALFAVTSNDTINLEISLTSKSLSSKLPVIVRNQDPHFARLFQQVFDFTSVLSPIDLAAPSFAAAALGGKILGNGMTGDSLWVALAALITPSHPFCGQRVQEAAMQADFVPLYLETTYGETIHSWKLLEATLTPGDVLYLTMPASQLDRLWRTKSLSSAISPTIIAPENSTLGVE